MCFEAACGVAATADQDPGAERDEHGRDHHVEGTRAGKELDPHDGAGDDTWNRSGEQDAGERAARLLLAPVAIQRAWRGDDVVEQIRRRYHGLGVPRTLTWNGSKRTAPDTPTGLARVAITNAATSATT